MGSEILFEEVQQYSRSVQLFIKIFIGLLLLSCVLSFLISFGGNTITLGLLTATFICALVGFFIGKATLITQIGIEGISVRFSPIERSFNKYYFHDIEQLFIRNYKPVAEFGGWGIRIGRKGKAYNISGNIGIQIVFRNKEQILIGTNEPHNISNVLLKLGKLDIPIKINN